MSILKTSEDAGSRVQTFEDKVAKQLQGAKARLEQLQAKVTGKPAPSKNAAISRLKTAKDNIDQKLRDLKTTHASNLARAKADINAEVARFTSSIEELGARFKTQSAKK